MADKAARSKQYEYRSNSNLVLQQERERPRENEPTGEVETLAGKIKHKMGDLAQPRQRDKELLDKLDKMKKRVAKKSEDDKQPRKKAKSKVDVLGAATFDEGSYRPKTKETRVVYEKLLNFVQGALGDVPQDITRGAAEEVLATLKNEGMKAPEKKVELERLLGPLTEHKFAELTDMAKNITDYTEEVHLSTKEGIDDELGVAVVFDEDEDEEDNEYELKEESDVEDEEGTEAAQGEMLATHDNDVDETEERDPLDLDPKEIKAFWLKGQIAQHVNPDPIASQALADQVMKALEEPDTRECENRLVQLLEYEKFDLIKLLLKNRLKIVYCTKLVHAEDDRERQLIEEEMKSDPALAPILEELTRTGKGKTLERTLKKEARNIKMKDKDVEMTDKGKTRNLLDLESLAFTQGAHFMANKECKLPPGSFRTQKKGYEEIHIPALKPPPIEENEKIILISEMPAWAQKAFDGMHSLNRIQSRLYKAAFGGHDNLLLCAPTGAGKTNVAMLCILRELGVYMNEEGQIDLDAFKIIYVAPMKSLVQEMVGNFSKRLGPYGITVRELSGDVNLTKQQIKETQIIVTTPEKWDIVTRKSGDRTYTQQVKLIIIDEIHLLHDDRGPVLETLVARTLRQIEATQDMVRIIGLSATLPNYEDVATFLRVSDENLFAFNNSYRPCPLEQQFIGITEKKPLKRYQIMNEITYEKVMDQAGKNQVLIFVHSRKETAKTARALRDMCIQNDTLTKFLTEGAASREILQTEAEATAKSADLKELLPYGFGIHHAGMVRSDRTLVEELFADGHIQVLVSTATLAWGVNLPAHAVIIRGTQIYNPEKGDWTELSPMDLMQMLGRSGRPAFDTYGEGIVITQHTQLQYYLSLMNCQLPIESQVVSRLPDILNAEIVLGTIQNVEEAVTWLGYTYLYVCMLRSPTIYGITHDEAANDKLLVQRRQDLIHSAATVLDKGNLIKYDKKTGNFQVTDLGIVASHYYVTYSSMAVYNEHLRPTMGDIELFRLFSLSSEFKYIAVRQEERAEMEKLMEKVPIPVKESIEEPSAKVNLLLQAFVSRLKLEGFALGADMAYVTQSGARIARALFDIVLKRGWAQLAERCLQLSKMIDRKMWGTQSPLRQFKDIPEEIIKKMERKDFPMERLYDLNSQEIGDLIGLASMGKAVHRHVHHFPKLELTAHVQPITSVVVRIELTITPDFQFDEKYHGKAEPFWIFVEDVDGEKILHSEYFILKQKFAEEDHVVTFTVPLFEPIHPQYFVKVISDRWIGSESVLPISFRHLILPAKFPAHTELLDLQPIPVSDVKNPQYEALFEFVNFNAIQTQVFSAVYSSDNNVFIGAPTGSGKTVCAELAILRTFSKTPQAKCVYVAPFAAIVHERMQDWKTKFAKLDKRVAELTGDTANDLKLLDGNHIILSTPENWDLLSKRWKQRKSIKNVQLFVVDELHLLGAENGPTLEVVVSRMRFISSQQENKIRVIGLASSIANAKDIAEWLGCSSHSWFNFHPSARPVPLEIHLQGFDIPHFGSRLMAMTRPTLSAVSHLGQEKPVIIFVPNRKVCRQVTKDLITFRDPEDSTRRFLKCKPEDIKPHLTQLKNKALKEALELGIGFYHESMTEAERALVEHLFNAGAVQVVVSTRDMCWGMSMSAYLVIIMNTQYYDGREHRYADYPVSDILQMMGRASRPLIDSIGKCVLLCFGPKKEFYKKFLYEPLPVESHLDHFLADHLNSEIVTKTIQNKQDAVDYLTWTFLYRRLTQNPNYYNLQGVTHRHLSDHLSELIENTLADLEQSKCVAVEDEVDVMPLNLGMIAAYYNIKYTSIEVFNSSLNAKTKLKGLVDILSAASEYDVIPVRHGEEAILRKLAAHLPLGIEKPSFTNARTKVNVLLQCHFLRKSLPVDMQADQNIILENSVRLLQAMVDVISSSSWLSPALATMELCQMITQAVWDKDPVLKQIPHFSQEIIDRCLKNKVETVFDVIDLEDDARDNLLRLSPKDMQDVARFCNAYPNVDVSFQVDEEDKIKAATQVQVTVKLDREASTDVGTAYAPFFPKPRAEGWWLCVGDTKTNQLLSIKRLTLHKSTEVKLDFKAPETPGEYSLMLYFMCDSYTGCDQEYEIKLNVQPGEPEAMQE